LKTPGLNSEFIEKHRLRYEALTSFFRKYNEQLHGYRFGTERPEGNCGVVELIDIMIKEKKELNDFHGNPDPVINWFFQELKKENEIH